MEDQQIVDLYWRRDADAIGETASKYGGYCRTIAQNILSDRQDAEECLNDTWMGAWNAMPPHRPRKLPAFLGKITRSIARDAVRARTAQKRGGGEYPAALEELGECVPSVPGADREVEDRELERMVDRFLHTLPERDCSVFLRRYWYGEGLAEIAASLGCGQGKVKSALFRIRKALRAYLEKEGVL